MQYQWFSILYVSCVHYISISTYTTQCSPPKVVSISHLTVDPLYPFCLPPTSPVVLTNLFSVLSKFLFFFNGTPKTICTFSISLVGLGLTFTRNRDEFTGQFAFLLLEANHENIFVPSCLKGPNCCVAPWGIMAKVFRNLCDYHHHLTKQTLKNQFKTRNAQHKFR